MEYSFSNFLTVVSAYICIGVFLGIGFRAVDAVGELISMIADKFRSRKHPKN